jgi:hypothetical protein
LEFQVLMVASMQMTVFCDVGPRNLVETDWLFGGAGSKALKFLYHYTAQHPWRQSSSKLGITATHYNMLMFSIIKLLWKKVYVSLYHVQQILLCKEQDMN